MEITRRSPISGREVTLEVPCTPEQIKRWRSGVLIQEAMPDVPAALREFVKTGITPEDWETLFGRGPAAC